MKKHEKEASEKIMQLLCANWINHALYVVVKLEIPDILSDGPKSIKKLSEITKSHSPYLYRIMKALASANFFYEEKNRVFSLSSLGEMLQKDKMQPIVLLFLSEWHNHAWEKLLHSVQSGDIAFNAAFGMSCFEWFKNNPEKADVFNKANQIKAMQSHAVIIKNYDFSALSSIVDIGGGYGGLLFSILKAFPNIQGVIADLPYMRSKVERQIADNSLIKRCDFYECDFFNQIPAAYDCYILSNILHDWDDKECKKILQNCYNVMPGNGILIIVESIVPEGKEFSIAKLLDLEVLVMGGGKERTEIEYRKLLNRSGFSISKRTETKESISILECVKT